MRSFQNVFSKIGIFRVLRQQFGYFLGFSKKFPTSIPIPSTLSSRTTLDNFVSLRMSATRRSYKQNFFKVQYIIIQTILSRKSMKEIVVTDQKIFRVYQGFDRKKK